MAVSATASYDASICSKQSTHTLLLGIRLAPVQEASDGGELDGSGSLLALLLLLSSRTGRWLCSCSYAPDLAGGKLVCMLVYVWGLEINELCVGENSNLLAGEHRRRLALRLQEMGAASRVGSEEISPRFHEALYIYMRCCARWAWAEGCCLGQAMLNLTGPYIIGTGIYYLRVYGYVVVCTRTHTRHTDG